MIDIFAGSGAYLGQLTGLSEACGVAVDSGGDVYVGDYSSRLKKFSPTANPPVNSDLVATFSEPSGLCTLVAGAGPTASSLFSSSYLGPLYKQDPATGQIDYTVFPGPTTTETVAPGSGHVFAASGSEVQELDATGSSNAVPVARVKAQGTVNGVAVDSSGNVYVSRSGSSEIEVFATPVSFPTVTATDATSVTGTKATLNGTVNPEGEAVTECFFEYGVDQSYGQTAPCETLPPTDSNVHPVSARATGLVSDGAVVHYRLVAANANGSEISEDHTLVTANTVSIEPATSIGAGAATINGIVRPEGIPYTACKFEYGPATSAGFEKEASCNPSATDIPLDFAAHAVSAALTGLQGSTTYKFRLTATNSNGMLTSEENTFTTFGPPVIAEVRALNASQSAATIEGRVNPSGFATSYRFEWGPTTSYGNQVPAELEPFIGEGSKPIRVSAKLSGLSAGTTYHYRLVASSSVGITATPDQLLETLNSCGLPEERCVELVSRRAAGPVAIPGGGAEVVGAGPGELFYGVDIGYPDATKGAHSLWFAKRTPSGWGPSTQISPPVTGPEEKLGGLSASSSTEWISGDLSCALQTSASALTADPGVRMNIEAGATNLYRRNPDGSYTAITTLPITNMPELKEAAENGGIQFVPMMATPDCSKVIFTTRFHFPGVPGKGDPRLYEWEEGTLRNAGIVPGPSGEVAAQVLLGGPTISSRTNTANVYSEDGSRVFFTATRETSSNPAEIGNRAVFAREDGERTIDISLSETATPDTGATYMDASRDGSRVFFTANAGLADESSVAGTDLYEYDFEKPEGERLTDLSISTEAGGAQVAGMLGESEDGSRVYFAARGQLLPGHGNSFAENQSADTYSIYGESGGSLDFVGTVTAEDVEYALVNGREDWRSHVSADGRFLLFESSAKVTGYESGGVVQAYLYDAAATSEAAVCVSCRSDGKPPLSPDGNRLVNQANSNTRNLIVRGGEPRVFFSSPNPLAPGAQEGKVNFYEWSHGQVFRLASQVGEGQSPWFSSASEDGTDVYFSTTETLNWEDGDARSSVYDARVGGGFPEPPPAPAPCDANAEGSCQGPAQGAPAVPGAASASFNGPGNPKQAPPQKKKSKKKKPKKHTKKKGSSKKARHANGNRRAGK